MGLFQIIAALITLAAVFSYLNRRYIRMPMTIGIMLIALLMSALLIALHRFGWTFDEQARALLAAVDFNRTLFQGMLAFLLFAGALHVELSDLVEDRWVITSLATVGVVLSTVIVGALMWLLLKLVGLGIPAAYCFLFGALISPTDPIAVLGILKSVGAPKSLEAKIAGESLFNDGIGVVVFILLLEVATGGHDVTVRSVATLFAQEALGGAAFGFGSGAVAYFMLKSVDDYQVEILITLALVMGTYALAGVFHLSGPIAVVVAGLLTGNRGRRLAMSARTREHLDTFWELIDEILNAVLFVLIGLEVLVLAFTARYVVAGCVAIPIVLFARLVSVSAPVKLLGWRRDFDLRTIRILTWAGLRGGISVALALALPRGPEREVIVAITYSVVLFSIVVQGLSIGWVIRHSGIATLSGQLGRNASSEAGPTLEEEWTI
ncbi:MAG: cation:proton antiporter [Candidatus Binatia bacterium]